MKGKKMKAKAAVTTVMLMLVVALCGVQARSQTTRELAKSSMESVCMLVMQDANGQVISLGSGFVVKHGAIATNLHVLENAARGYVKFIGSKIKIPVEGVFAVDASHDLAVLAVQTATAKPLALSPSDSMEVGDAVYAIGNPQGLEGTFSQGIVSGVRSIGGDKILQITAPISPGSSGGPVLDSVGQVIGLAVATLRGGQNLNFAVPSGYLRPLIANLTSPTPLSAARPPSGGAAKESIGRPSTEAVVGSQWTWDNPILLGMNSYYHGAFSLSLRNGLDSTIRDVYCLAIFYDSNSNPIDVAELRYSGTIPAGLAKRIKGKVDGSVQQLATKAVFRVLDFQVVE